jgi:restriction endonuclease Mrr
MISNKLDALSVQQKKLLGDGLRAHYRMPMDLAGHMADPGCFGVKEGRKIDIETGRVLPILDRKAREVRRTSKARAITRLVKRGLLESPSRGKWRLTRRGLVVARKLWPEILPPTEQEVARDIAFREAVHAVVGGRRRKRPRAKAPQARAKVAAAGDSGIEIPFDF